MGFLLFVVCVCVGGGGGGLCGFFFGFLFVFVYTLLYLMPKGRRVSTPQTIDIEISGIFRPPTVNLIHNARSKVFIQMPPLLYTAGSEIPTNI